MRALKKSNLVLLVLVLIALAVLVGLYFSGTIETFRRRSHWWKSRQMRHTQRRSRSRSRRPSYRSRRPSYRSRRPSYRSRRPSYRSRRPSYRSRRPSYRSRRPSYRGRIAKMKASIEKLKQQRKAQYEKAKAEADAKRAEFARQRKEKTEAIEKAKAEYAKKPQQKTLTRVQVRNMDWYALKACLDDPNIPWASGKNWCHQDNTAKENDFYRKLTEKIKRENVTQEDINMCKTAKKTEIKLQCNNAQNALDRKIAREKKAAEETRLKAAKEAELNAAVEACQGKCADVIASGVHEQSSWATNYSMVGGYGTGKPYGNSAHLSDQGFKRQRACCGCNSYCKNCPNKGFFTKCHNTCESSRESAGIEGIKKFERKIDSMKHLCEYSDERKKRCPPDGLLSQCSEETAPLIALSESQKQRGFR